MAISPRAEGELTTRQLAKALDLDRRGVARDIKRGMPRTIQGARAWRLAFVAHRRGHDQSRSPGGEEASTVTHPPAAQVVPVDFAVPDSEEPEDLHASLGRLRRLERSTAAAIEQLLSQGKTTEAIALRREHATILRGLFDSSAKLLKLEEASGKLIPVSRALSMINDSLQPGLLMLRRLPELGKTAEQRSALESFVNAILEEFKAGATANLKRSESAAG